MEWLLAGALFVTLWIGIILGYRHGKKTAEAEIKKRFGRVYSRLNGMVDI
jgi:hypothetical protein